MYLPVFSHQEPVMFVGLLIIVHHLLYFCSMPMRIIIYLYLKKKPPGLQTVLDLLIIDLLRLQMFNHTFFIIFLLSGYLHGHLPFYVSEVMIFILTNGQTYLFGLFQFFLIAKAVMIFKRSWLDEVNDSWVIGFSRSFALVYTFIIFIGTFLTKGAAPSVMIKFLTGTDAKQT